MSVFTFEQFTAKRLEVTKDDLRQEVKRLKGIGIPAKIGKQHGRSLVVVPSNYEGYCYMISDGMGAVKIGKASVPEGRLRELQVAHARPLSLIRVFEGGHAAEKWLHNYYAARRMLGEWFNYCPTMLSVEPFFGNGEAA